MASVHSLRFFVSIVSLCIGTSLLGLLTAALAHDLPPFVRAAIVLALLLDAGFLAGAWLLLQGHPQSRALLGAFYLVLSALFASSASAAVADDAVSSCAPLPAVAASLLGLAAALVLFLSDSLKRDIARVNPSETRISPVVSS